MITHSCSDGISLHFPDVKLSMEYDQALLKLNVEHYIKVRNKYGVWAGNQNKFVEHVDNLNEMDTRHMEKLVSRYASEWDFEVEPHRGRVKLNGKAR